jgi:hypothetical protein
LAPHTVVELQNEGFEVILIDDLSNTLEGFGWYRIYW